MESPHFEKMLYDNGQIVSLYCAAYQKFQDEDYKNLVYGTLGFIEREMRSDEGAFYSALDADSDEGEILCMEEKELMSFLGDNYALLQTTIM